MKLQKLIAFLLATLLCLSLVACDDGEQKDEGATDTTADTQAENGEETTGEEQAEEQVIYYDDYVTALGDIWATDDGVTVSEGAPLEIVTKGGVTYFDASDVGEATVTRGDHTVRVFIDRAKINFIVIMGQSNSGNHFANATSDITCPIGTAYWWGNGQGTKATEPVDFTQATKGFHSTLLAELYAQSVAAGDPAKNVLIWHEGGSSTGDGTSKNGSSIYGWASSPTNTEGTDYTVQMIENCENYYKSQKDKYVINSKGVYWLQGEGDGVRGIDPNEYIACLEAIWTKLKVLGGMDYLAIMRVRKGGDLNTLNNDIDYSTVSAAQFALANKHPDIFIATTITESFTGAPTEEKSIDITDYIRMMELYSKKQTHNDTYGNAATYADGVLTTAMKTLFGSNNKNHYGKFGYTLIASDAAYNMYRAINGSKFGFLVADSSGSPAVQKTSAAGDTVTLDITGVSADLAFRASQGSTAGTFSITVKAGGTDVTSSVVNTSGASYGCVSTAKLKTYSDVVITATYTTVKGETGSVTYNVQSTAK